MNVMAANGPGLKAATADTFTILTVNLALVAVPLSSGLDISISPYLNRRLKAAPAALRTSGADILMLQEVFTARCRNFLLESMKDSHPYAFWQSGETSLMGNGLVILSRWPIDSGKFIPFRGKNQLLQTVWQRGVLNAELRVPGIGAVHAMNVHLSPDPPFAAPDRARTRTYRAREIEALLAAAAGHDGEIVLAGDFNASPELCPDDYRLIVERGYIDTFANIHGARSIPTFARANLLVRKGRYRDWPDQRADHILLGDKTRLGVVSADIVFQEPLPRGRGDASCPLSDHYGVQVTLAR